MRPFALSTIALLCFAIAIAAGCGSRNKKNIGEADKLDAATLLPSNEAEQAVLSHLENNPKSESFSVQGARVHLGAPYFAASGAECRTVTIEAPSSSGKLACRKGDRWFFAPQVFSAAEEPIARTAPEEAPQ